MPAPSTGVLLLGDDDLAIPVLQEMIDSGRYTLVAASDTAGIDAPLGELSSDIERLPDWETALSDHRIGLVLLATDEPRLAEAARQLASDGRDLIVLPRYEHGSAFLYELSILRDVDGIALTPVSHTSFDTGLGSLCRAIQDWSDESILHIEIHHSLPGEQHRLLSRDQVSRALLFHVITLRKLIRNLPEPSSESDDRNDDGSMGTRAKNRKRPPNYNKVTALYSGHDGEGFSRASVTLGADSLPEAVITFSPEEKSSCRLVIHTSIRKLELQRNTDGFWHAADDRTRVLLDNVSACSADISAIIDQNTNRERNDWLELIRCQETVEATDRSRRRSRTIDLHFEVLSERSQFKTQMTAIGCTLLTLTLFAVILVLSIGALFNVPEGVMKLLRIVVFLPLFIFLVMQFFIAMTRRSEG